MWACKVSSHPLVRETSRGAAASTSAVWRRFCLEGFKRRVRAALRPLATGGILSLWNRLGAFERCCSAVTAMIAVPCHSVSSRPKAAAGTPRSAPTPCGCHGAASARERVLARGRGGPRDSARGIGLVRRSCLAHPAKRHRRTSVGPPCSQSDAPTFRACACCQVRLCAEYARVHSTWDRHMNVSLSLCPCLCLHLSLCVYVGRRAPLSAPRGRVCAFRLSACLQEACQKAWACR